MKIFVFNLKKLRPFELNDLTVELSDITVKLSDLSVEVST